MSETIEVYSVEEQHDVTTDRVDLSQTEWRQRLTPEQHRVLRRHGTERSFSGEYWDTKERGLYRCLGCGNDLFLSDTKFDSGTGWPSFWAPVSNKNIATQQDTGLFMRRTEVHCARCGGHLGHVFPDGPEPTGERYCLNSVSLRFEPSEPSK